MQASFGDELRRYRAHRSQRWLAAKLGVSPSTVAGWEAGTVRPTLPHLVHLIEVLDVPRQERLKLFTLAAAQTRPHEDY